MTDFDKYHGTVTLTYADGSSYEGDFTNNRPNGMGKMTYPDGNKTVYEGKFHNGLPNGYGTYTLPNGGASYTGQFKDISMVKEN